MKFETMDDVLEWLQVPCNETDTLSKQLGVKLFRLNEENYEKVCAIVAAQSWMPMRTMKSSFENDEDYYNGRYLMFSEKNGVQRVYHGYEDERGRDVWLFTDGVEMREPTHWMFLPQPPKRESL